jgi:hypothetical protein
VVAEFSDRGAVVKTVRTGIVSVVALLLALIWGVTAVSADPTHITGPDKPVALARDATTLSFNVVVTGARRTYLLQASLDDRRCVPPGEAVIANHTTNVTFDLSSCQEDLSKAAASQTVVLKVGNATTISFRVNLGSAAGPVPWSDGLSPPLHAGLIAGVVTLVLACLYAWAGIAVAKTDRGIGPADTDSLRPLPGRWWWELPGQSMTKLDWTGGIVAKLVFVGAAITSILALSDNLSPALTSDQQLVLASVNIAAALIAGAATLAVNGFQAKYTPYTQVPDNADPAHPKVRRGLALGDVELVASVPGVILGAAITAAAVVTQVWALRWAANVAHVASWTQGVFFAFGVIVVFYCMTVAGSLVVSGLNPPIMPKPDKPAKASAQPKQRVRLLP